MKKDKRLIILCVILALACVGTLPYGYFYRQNHAVETFKDGVELIDVNKIYLMDSDVTVTFSEVIIGKHEEVRKLIVSTKEATVSTELSESLIKILGLEIGTKKQRVSYKGEGLFVVNLDGLAKDDIIQNRKNKTITMLIDHAYLQTVEINPNNVIIDEVQESLLARGDIKLTVRDYNAIEKELITRMTEKLNVAENAQEADVLALRMVKEIYEPLIKAIDSRYELVVEFK